MMELLSVRIIDLPESYDTFYRLEELRPSDPCFGWRSTVVITMGIQNAWRLISRENPMRISLGTRGCNMWKKVLKWFRVGPITSICVLLSAVDLGIAWVIGSSRISTLKNSGMSLSRGSDREIEPR